MKLVLKSIFIVAFSLAVARSKTCYKHVPNACVRESSIEVANAQSGQTIESCKKVCNANENCKTVEYQKSLQICQFKSDTTLVEGCFGSGTGQFDSYQKTACVTVFSKVMKTRVDELETSISGDKTQDSLDQFDDVLRDLQIRKYALEQILPEDGSQTRTSKPLSTGQDTKLINLLASLVMLFVSVFILNFFNACCKKGVSEEGGYGYEEVQPSRALQDGDSSWFCIHWGDFCNGDASSECCWNFDEAKRIVMSKPRTSEVAYQYWRPFSRLFTKPAGRGGTWTNEHTNNDPSAGHLFIYGVFCGQQGAYHLMYMDGFDAKGNDSNGTVHSAGQIETKEQAIAKIKELANPNAGAYFWCRSYKSIIEKNAGKRCGKWDRNNGILFIWANKVIR